MSTAGKFNKLERLGDGTYGVVYKAESKATREVVALKRMNPAPEEEGVPATTIREIALLKELKHINVVRLNDLMFESPKLTLIFEYCEWDLKKLMDAKGELTVPEIRTFLRQLLEGLAYCHHRSVVHRDLKPQNLLIEDPKSERKKEPADDASLRTRDCTELVLKLADFGLARVEGLPVKKYSHEVVTLWYRSPDVILGSTNYGLPVDLWSVGCIFAEMASGVPMFNAKTDMDQLIRMFKILGTPTKETWPSMMLYPNAKTMLLDQRIGDTKYPPALHEYCASHNVSRIGEDGMNLLAALLRYEPGQRITAVEALNHPFLLNPEQGPRPPVRSSGAEPSRQSTSIVDRLAPVYNETDSSRAQPLNGDEGGLKAAHAPPPTVNGGVRRSSGVEGATAGLAGVRRLSTSNSAIDANNTSGHHHNSSMNGSSGGAGSNGGEESNAVNGVGSPNHPKAPKRTSSDSRTDGSGVGGGGGASNGAGSSGSHGGGGGGLNSSTGGGAGGLRLHQTV
jgi:cyclin-dependent kinase